MIFFGGGIRYVVYVALTVLRMQERGMWTRMSERVGGVRGWGKGVVREGMEGVEEGVVCLF